MSFKGYMQLARINFAEVTGHHHTWADNGGVDKGFLVYSLLLQLAVPGYEGVCLEILNLAVCGSAYYSASSHVMM